MVADIWVPPSFTKDKDREVLVCFVCDATFEMDQQERFERHVAACSDANEDQIERELDESNPARIMPEVFGPEAGDVEFERWMKANAKDVLLGKKKV